MLICLRKPHGLSSLRSVSLGVALVVALVVALRASRASAEDRVAEPASPEVSAPPAPSPMPPVPVTPAPPADTVVLHVGGRLQFDHYNYLAPGAADAGLQSTFLLKRFDIELSGEIAQRWQFFLQADVAPAGLDPAQSPALKPGSAIVILNATIAPALHVQVGQLLTPVTLDHRFLSKERVILENGLVQQIGAPSPVELGTSVWGETAKQILSYEVGVFNGDGANRWSPDNRVDVIGRIGTRPLAATDHLLRDAQLGGSLRVGSRDPERITYDAPSLATQGGFRFWRPTYDGPGGVTHIIPAGQQVTLAADAHVPFGRFDVLGEVVHVRNGTREASADEHAATRTGTFSGLAAYGQLGVWVMGSRDVLGPDTLRASALEVVARAEVLRARYEGGSRSAAPDAPNVDGDIRVNALLFGAKYWWNPHIRGSANYCMYDFPGSGPVMADPGGSTPGQTARQRAVAPGNTLGPGASEAARASHTLYELLFRLELGF